MSFRSWFRHWMQALLFLFTLGTRPYKSERQRKKERERRKRAKYGGVVRYRVQKRARRRVRRHYKTLFAITNVLFWTFCVLLLPIGIFDWGYQSAKRRRHKAVVVTMPSGEKTRVETRAKKMKADDKTTASPTQKPKNSTGEIERSPFTHVSSDKMTTLPSAPPTPIASNAERERGVTAGEKTAVRDENTPKSKPLHKGDQYIRKRMIIEGTDRTDPAVLAKLTVGTCVDIVAEPTNLREKNTVSLFLKGERVGYIPEFDAFMFVISFRLNRRAYGVITEVIGEPPFTRYRFEAWLFDGKSDA